MKCMTKLWLPTALAAALLPTVLLPTVARGAEAISQETLSSLDAKIGEINDSLSKAADLYRGKKFEEFGKLIGEVEQTLEELKSGDLQGDLLGAARWRLR